MTKRVTQRERFVEIANFLEGVGAPVEFTDFIDERIAALDKRANAPRAKTKDQIANEAVKAEILDAIANGANRAGAIAKELDTSTQKVTALLTQLVKAGKVVRVVDGKTVTFVLPE